MRDPQERINELLAATVRFEQRARDAELLVKRLRAALIEATKDNVWAAYYTGIVRTDLWRPGGMSDAEWLARELGLAPSGCYDPCWVTAQFDRLVEKLVGRAERGES